MFEFNRSSVIEVKDGDEAAWEQAIRHRCWTGTHLLLTKNKAEAKRLKGSRMQLEVMSMGSIPISVDDFPAYKVLVIYAPLPRVRTKSFKLLRRLADRSEYIVFAQAPTTTRQLTSALMLMSNHKSSLNHFEWNKFMDRRSW